ncbi:MAG TPA: UbiX family flavin prenyltransferase, partial [Armatimonadota bacterium]|nr:UbiX family flavin prenyltransferase [Armatimonadota bacterium]
ITGASGSLYAVRFLARAVRHFDPVYLTVSGPAVRVAREELGIDLCLEGDVPRQLLPEVPEASRVRYYRKTDYDAPFASGSAAPDAMVIVPCSMGTLARIAAGTSDDLVHRAADVMLKERKKLILVPRETPLSLVHARNILAVTEAGAVVMPAAPGLYHRPRTVEEMVDFVVFRILDHLGIKDPEARRWRLPPDAG